MIDLGLVNRLFPLESKYVKIDIFTEKHISDAYLGWLNDSEVVNYSSQRFQTHTRQTCLDYLRSYVSTESILLAIYLRAKEEYVGTMSIHFSLASETAEMRIMIGNKDCWGQGVGGDAWSTILSFLLETVGVSKVHGGTLRCNTSMVEIMTKCGMELDEVLPAYELIDGLGQDALIFSKFRKQ